MTDLQPTCETCQEDCKGQEPAETCSAYCGKPPEYRCPFCDVVLSCEELDGYYLCGQCDTVFDDGEGPVEQVFEHWRKCLTIYDRHRLSERAALRSVVDAFCQRLSHGVCADSFNDQDLSRDLSALLEEGEEALTAAPEPDGAWKQFGIALGTNDGRGSSEPTPDPLAELEEWVHERRRVLELARQNVVGVEAVRKYKAAEGMLQEVLDRIRAMREGVGDGD